MKKKLEDIEAAGSSEVGDRLCQMKRVLGNRSSIIGRRGLMKLKIKEGCCIRDERKMELCN
jgi:hypothetical protein